MMLVENGGGSQFAHEDGGSQAVSDSFFSPPPPPTPPPYPNNTEALGDFFALPYNAEVETTNNSDSPTPLTGPDSPFSIFADLVQGAIGGAGAPARQPQSPTLVPVSTSGGGGIGAGALLLVLALIGGAVWWFFFRKKKGASNAS